MKKFLVVIVTMLTLASCSTVNMGSKDTWLSGNANSYGEFVTELTNILIKENLYGRC